MNHPHLLHSVLKARLPVACFALAVLAGPGCVTLRHTAAIQLGDALAESGSTFATDDDPELVRSAAPFSLKLIEGLLAETPSHRGLRLAAARGFTQYAFVFLEQDADLMADQDFAGATLLRARARRLYLRARDHGLRGLDSAHGGFPGMLRADPKAAVMRTGPDDVPLLYWTAAAWGAAIALSKDNAELIADQVRVEALIDRALELNERFEAGAIHAFLIPYEMARPGAAGDPAARARRHFERAMELCAGGQAGPLVSLAETVAVAKQDRTEFQALLKQALAIDPAAHPEWRLANLVMQRRARWLLARTDELILPDSNPSVLKETP
ncbi:MAG: TRAP transporter TatT component family protein [Opitutaceae bacterium]|nr:TRAP transporter TatT component family protein [Opitutaceae bacterium]